MTLAQELAVLATWLEELPHMECRSLCDLCNPKAAEVRSLAAKCEGKVAVKPEVHFADEDETFGASIFVDGKWVCSDYVKSKAEAITSLQVLLDEEATT
jgi:hypothetical protein